MTTPSNQPHRRGRPVVAPYSLPRARIVSASLPVISVGNGPPPTRVEYALATPSTPWIFVGGTPVPVAAPPAVVDDDVMYGYVPWSMSSIVACAPSKSTEYPPSIHFDKRRGVSVMYGASQPAN